MNTVKPTEKQLYDDILVEIHEYDCDMMEGEEEKCTCRAGKNLVRRIKNILAERVREALREGYVKAHKEHLRLQKAVKGKKARELAKSVKEVA